MCIFWSGGGTRVLSRKQERILRKLTEYAGGDSGLVQDAIIYIATGPKEARKMSSVLKYIDTYKGKPNRPTRNFYP